MTDIDGDGYTDVLFQHSLGREFRVFWGNMEGVLTEVPTIVPASRMGSSANGSDAADLDGDGHVDLIGVATEAMGFVVTRGLGERIFGPTEFIDSGQVPIVVHADDWNSDEAPDLLYLLMGEQNRLDWRPGSVDALRFGSGRSLVDDVLAFDIADIGSGGGAELVVANTETVRVFQPLPDWRVGRPIATWPMPLYNVTSLRVLDTHEGPRVYVGGIAPDGAAAAVVFDDSGSACTIPLTGGTAFDFGYFNQDKRPDYTHAESCGYCTTQYRVMIGTE